MNWLLSRWDDQQRRWYAAVESNRLGHGGDQLVAQVTGRDPHTIQRGRRERAAARAERPTDRVRMPGAGRPRAEKKVPLLETDLREIVTPETAGDPMTPRKWIRSRWRRRRQRLADRGHTVSAPTVSRLLNKHDDALRVNAQQKEARSPHPDRDTQFPYIEVQKAAWAAAGGASISVDTKTKAWIGHVKHAGQAWCQQPEAVNGHDFWTDALGRAVPYGIMTHGRRRGGLCRRVGRYTGVCRHRDGAVLGGARARGLSAGHATLDPGRWGGQVPGIVLACGTPHSKANSATGSGGR